jgi:hypothetical protein
MRAYHRLTEGERNQVYALKKSGLTQCHFYTKPNHPNDSHLHSENAGAIIPH